MSLVITGNPGVGKHTTTDLFVKQDSSYQIIDINKLPYFSRLLDGKFVKVVGSGHAGHSKKTPLIKSFFLGLSPLMNRFLGISDAETPKILGPINF